MFTILSFILILTLFLAWWTLDTSKIRRGLTIILAAILFTYMGLNYIGFCWEQFRFFSDKEFVRIATLEARSPFILYYSDADEYILNHPNDFTMDDASSKNTIWYSFFSHCSGKQAKVVTIKYNDTMTGKEEHVSYLISNCGKVWSD